MTLVPNEGIDDCFRQARLFKPCTGPAGNGLPEVWRFVWTASNTQLSAGTLPTVAIIALPVRTDGIARC